jgi:hypothetical protein
LNELGYNKIKKPLNHRFKGFLILLGIAFVGMAGFEPAASTSQMWRDTGLRYIPKWLGRKYSNDALISK